jgi:hypothetical protein
MKLLTSLILISSLVVAGCQSQVTVLAPAAPAAITTGTAPATATAFLIAYGAGDEAAAEGLASPLYGAEWARRGLSVRDRLSVRGRGPRSESPPTRLDFSYINGSTDRDGSGRHLYLARPSVSGGIPTVWRVDADQRGRVIWAEMVWLFADSLVDPQPVLDAGAASGLPLPPDLAALHPRLVAGVRARSGTEGYYAFEIETPTAVGGQAATVFMGVDEDGDARPGAWSYGRPDPGLRGYPPRR